MDDQMKLTPHETLELHELLSSSVIAAKKTKATIPMIDDEELKNFMQSSLDAKKASIQQLQQFIQKTI